MPCGESADDGNVIFLEILGKHFFGGGVFQIRTGIHEFTKNHSADIFKNSMQLQGVEHTVYVVQGFSDFFHKENDSIFCEYVDIGCAHERHERGHVAADKDAFSSSFLIVFVLGNLVCRNFALEQVAHECAVVIGAARFGDEGTHCAVNAHDSGFGLHGMQCRDVAKADEPLGVLLYEVLIDQVD